MKHLHTTTCKPHKNARIPLSVNEGLPHPCVCQVCVQYHICSDISQLNSSPWPHITSTATSLAIIFSPLLCPAHPLCHNPIREQRQEWVSRSMEGFCTWQRTFFSVASKKLTASWELSVRLSESPVNPHYPLQHCIGGLAEYKWPHRAPPVLSQSNSHTFRWKSCWRRERVKCDLGAGQVFTAC